jgi:hypothetical protein
MIQLFVGLMAEGSTDYRFLKPIIESTLIKIAHECTGDVTIDVLNINYNKSGSFRDYVLSAAKSGLTEYGIMILVVHADADNLSSDNTYRYKIKPAFELISKVEDAVCRNIVPIVPVFETESWLLADKDVFKRVIGTKKSDFELGIDGNPELMSRPKEKIENAIRIGRLEMPKKMREKIKIDDLYSIIGESLKTDKLIAYKSYKDFELNLRKELIELNYLQR